MLPGVSIPFNSYEQMLLQVFAPFEKAYLSKSLTRLFDAVNQLFTPAGKALPGKTELVPLTKTFIRSVNVKFINLCCTYA